MPNQPDLPNEPKSPEEWMGELSHLYALQKPKFESQAILKSEFCLKCAAAFPDIGYLRKLFSGVENIKSLAPPLPPKDNTPESAQAYVDAYRLVLALEVGRIHHDKAFEIGRLSANKFGAHFSGKLLHSSMKDAKGFAISADTKQPHLSSRRLLSNGIVVPPDAIANDATGTYQRVIGIMLEDGEARKSGVPAELVEAIRAGAEEGFSEASKANKANFIDSRARQILLPCGDNYLSVSPLVSGGMCQLVDDTILKIEEDVALLLAEDNSEEKSKTRKKVETGSVNTDGTDEVESKKKPPKRLYSRIDLGGANKQNITNYGRAAQNAFLFESPQRDVVSSQVFRFLFRQWKPTITAKDWMAAKNGIEKTIRSDQSDSTLDIYYESKNQGLVALIMKCHQQAADLSFDLLDAVLKNDSDDNQDNVAISKPDEIRIDEALLKTKRPDKGQPSDLDMAILNRNFNDVYCKSMADAIVARLKYLANQNAKTPLIHTESDISRITKAVILILEGIAK